MTLSRMRSVDFMGLRNPTRPRAWPAGLVRAFVAFALSTPVLSMAACKVSAVEMPITMVGPRAVATLGINGTEVRMTVDSGAFYSMLTDAAAAQLQLPVTFAPWGLRVQGVTGPVEARMTTVKRMQLVRGEIPDVEFIVGGNEPGSGTMGLLGRNILSITDTEYDLAHGAIRFMFPDGDCDGKSMAYWADAMPVSQLDLRRDASQRLPALRGVAKLNGQDVRVMFDTGAVSIVSLAAAKRAGLTEADMKPAGLMRGAGSGEAKTWVAEFKTFALAGETSENNRLRVGDFDSKEFDMLLGVDFFLSHRLYVSKTQRRMYFTYNGGPVFALNAAAVTADTSTGVDGPEDAAGFARRGAARAARRDYVHALEDLDRACELAPQVADYFVQRGLIHKALRHVPQARQDIDTALTLDARRSDARWERALLRVAARDRAGALDDLQWLDGLLQPQAHRRLDMAQLYASLHLQDKALAQLDLWIPVHRNEAGLENALNARCWARAMLGVELDKALADCDKALDFQPKNPSFLDSRAWVRLRRGDVREALSDYDRALKIKPDGAWSLYGRGLARIRLGETEPGRADLEAARKLLPDIEAQTGHYGLAAASDGTPKP